MTSRKLCVAAIGCIVFLFVVAPVMAEGTVTWDGSADSDWFNSNNWDTAQVPADGDDVVIGGGVSVVLSNSTANLSSFMITNATLTFTNWTTALDATNVTIQKSGKLQHKACDTNAAPSNTNRVYVVCSNLTIEAGGSINVNYLGYPGGPAANTWGQGPGGGFERGGGGYGGEGGFFSGAGIAGPTYGSSNEPVQPGSGGGGFNDTTSAGLPGGGAVRIVATGRVTVNGTITANGMSGTARGGSGSGGGIYINCITFAGTNGLIRANGGNADTVYGDGGAGGGGRIAVDYNVAAQSNLNLTDKPSVRFSANQGNGYHVGDPGTIYLSDAGFYPSATMYGGELTIPGFSSWAVESLTITGGRAVFPSGFQLTVTNNVTVSGAGGGIRTVDATVTVGSNLTISAPYSSSTGYKSKSYFVGGSNSETVVSGDVIIDQGYLSFSSVSTNTHALLVGGDIIVTNGGRFYVFAGLTNASTPDYGALVSVTNDVYIAPSSWIYPISDKTNANAGTALFRMRNLTIATSSGFNANGLGFDGGQATKTWGYGPGRGYYSGGGGYGGMGGEGYWTGSIGGTNYGSSNAPVHPGSGGGGYNDTTCTGKRGGGSVRIEATRKVTVNGTITANGIDNDIRGGCGSGGGIYIRCRTFAGDATGILRANGGNGELVLGDAAGGGGGRIAVWRTYHTYEGTSSVTGGTAYSPHEGEDGTIVWGYIPPPGMIFYSY